MIDTDRDYQTELNTLRTQIDQLVAQITADRFHSVEARTNASLKLGSLYRQIPVLEWQAEVQNQRLDWIADAVRMAGDPDLGFIAYVVFGSNVLPW